MTGINFLKMYQSLKISTSEIGYRFQFRTRGKQYLHPYSSFVDLVLVKLMFLLLQDFYRLLHIGNMRITDVF